MIAVKQMTAHISNLSKGNLGMVGGEFWKLLSDVVSGLAHRAKIQHNGIADLSARTVVGKKLGFG